MRILKPIFTVLVLGAIIFVIYQWFIFPLFSGKTKLVHIIDPDTFLVLEGGKLKKIQLIGVDAPEYTHSKNSQCFDKEAKKMATKYFSTQREITLEKDDTIGDKDIYQRELRHVKMVDGSLVNEALLRDGLAKIYNPENKNFKYKDNFLQAENGAKAAGVGIWDQNGCNGVF